MKTGLGLGPSLSRPKDRTGPDLQTLNVVKQKVVPGARGSVPDVAEQRAKW